MLIDVGAEAASKMLKKHKLNLSKQDIKKIMGVPPAKKKKPAPPKKKKKTSNAKSWTQLQAAVNKKKQKGGLRLGSDLKKRHRDLLHSLILG